MAAPVPGRFAERSQEVGKCIPGLGATGKSHCKPNRECGRTAAGVAAFSGRILQDKKRNTREFYSVPRADMWFKLELAKIYPKEGDAK